MVMICTKCGSSRFNEWKRCMDCRNARGKVRAARLLTNGGKHTASQWKALLASSPTCAVCGQHWADIPPRRDARYKSVWTKGHKLAVYHGGTNDIGNIQAECFKCNFQKNAGSLKRTGA
ncbi:HNH endonuclease [Methylobacterium sp. WL120]|nr:HNH endonuclease [Methylobacterium sp. WL120]